MEHRGSLLDQGSERDISLQGQKELSVMGQGWASRGHPHLSASSSDQRPRGEPLGIQQKPSPGKPERFVGPIGVSKLTFLLMWEISGKGLNVWLYKSPQTSDMGPKLSAPQSTPAGPFSSCLATSVLLHASLLSGIPLRCLHNCRGLRIAPPQILTRGPQWKLRQESKPSQPERPGPEARGATAGPGPPGRAERQVRSHGRHYHPSASLLPPLGRALSWATLCCPSLPSPCTFRGLCPHFP